MRIGRQLVAGGLSVALGLGSPMAGAQSLPRPIETPAAAPAIAPAAAASATTAAASQASAEPGCTTSGSSAVSTGVACAAGAILGALLGGVGAVGGCALLAGSFFGAAKAQASSNAGHCATATAGASPSGPASEESLAAPAAGRATVAPAQP